MTKKKRISERIKRGRGRPVALEPDAKTKKTVKGLGEIQATVKECAAVLGVGEATYLRFLERHPDIDELFKRASEKGKSSLRRLQFKLAAKGHPTMLIWLGKQYLGQSDKTETRLGETETKPLRYKLSDEELLSIASSGNA